MPSVASLVRQAVEDDIVLSRALAEGIANYRATAAWLLEQKGWDASEGAVISALRRLDLPAENVFDRAGEVLERSHVNTRSHMCSVRLPSTEASRERLPELFDVVDSGQGEVLRVISSEKGFKIILDESNLSALEEAMEGNLLEDVKTDLTEVSVVIPPEARETPGILALVCNKLALHGINVEETVDGVHQHILLVSSEDAIEAHRQLAQLTGDA